jgi:hypothetical protein
VKEVDKERQDTRWYTKYRERNIREQKVWTWRQENNVVHGRLLQDYGGLTYLSPSVQYLVESFECGVAYT